jgi:hypothetical protein
MFRINRLPLCALAVLLLAFQSTAQQEITHHQLAATYVSGHEYASGALTLQTDGRYSMEGGSHDGTEFSESGTYVLAGGVVRFTIERSVKRRRGVEGEINLLEPQESREGKEGSGSNSTAGIAREFSLIPFRWSERIYLIKEDDLINFVNAVNLGLEPRTELRSENYYGAFYLRRGDELKRASGHPSLPAKWLSFLLSKSVTATVTAIEESQKGSFSASSTARIDKGSRDGLKVGMRLLINEEEPSTSLGAEIVSVEERTARIRIAQVNAELKIGDVVRTRDEPKLDEYGALSWEEEKKRLARFAARLLQRPDAQGYVIAYDGRRARAGEALARAERARAYLEKELKMESGRIVAVDGGYREDQAVELYAVRSGTKPPEPAPTINPGEVRTRRGNVKPGSSRR